MSEPLRASCEHSRSNRRAISEARRPIPKHSPSNRRASAEQPSRDDRAMLERSPGRSKQFGANRS
eukprot:581703-Alexandrium_andersonii.AAC.1